MRRLLNSVVGVGRLFQRAEIATSLAAVLQELQEAIPSQRRTCQLKSAMWAAP